MKCKFFRLIYPKSVEDAQNGSYTVALYAPCETVLDSQGNKLNSITVVGYYLPIMERMKVDIAGRWKKDAKYGLQFMMESYEEIIDPGKKGIVAYLSSGLFRGIGKRLAERIYNTFGDDALTILDNDPDRIKFGSVKIISQISMQTLGGMKSAGNRGGDRRKVCVNDKKGRYEKQRLSQEWK